MCAKSETEQQQSSNLHGEEALQDATAIRGSALGEQHEQVAQRRMDEIRAHIGNDFIGRRVALHKRTDVELGGEGVLNARTIEVSREGCTLRPDRIPIGVQLHHEVTIRLPAKTTRQGSPRPIVETSAGNGRTHRKRPALARSISRRSFRESIRPNGNRGARIHRERTDEALETISPRDVERRAVRKLEAQSRQRFARLELSIEVGGVRLFHPRVHLDRTPCADSGMDA